MDPHRDDLGAAHDRIQQLEERVRELESTPHGGPEPKGRKPRGPRSNKGGPLYALIGMGSLAFCIGGSVCGGTRACIAMDAPATDMALDQVRACPKAVALLGDDIGWSMIGCSTYKGRSGGDPLNGGCHSSGSYTQPIAGTKGRASYSFSVSSPPGKGTTFNGGWLVGNGVTISIPATGVCRN